MTRPSFQSRIRAALCMAALLLVHSATAPSFAQQPAKPSAPGSQAQAAPAQTVPSVKPVESQPLPPLSPPEPAAPSPGASAATPAPAPAPASPPVAPPAPPVAVAPSVPAGTIITLAPPPADPSTPDDVTLTARPAATMQAMSTWDDGYDALTRAFDRLQAEMGKAGIRVIGKPLSVFLETDDMGFRFEAQLPIEAAPAARPPGLPADINFGQTPAGPAIRFVHRAPYDDIDSTYEAISAYLDSKGIEVKDSFTEEYVTLGPNAGDAGLEVFIYVLPK